MFSELSDLEDLSLGLVKLLASLSVSEKEKISFYERHLGLP